MALFLSCLFCLAGTVTGFAADFREDLAEVQAILDASSAIDMQKLQVGTVAARSGQNYWEFANEILDAEGTMKAYGPITLGPNQILQAGLECPKNNSIDYDLYIATVVDGQLDEIVDGSTYVTPDGAPIDQIVDEGIDRINMSSETQQYALLVHAKKGSGDAWPYTVYLSLDLISNCNENENDQNAANPYYNLRVGQYLNGLVLNTGADVDWFTIDVEMDGSLYYSQTLSVTATDPTSGVAAPAVVELYKITGHNCLSPVVSAGTGTWKIGVNEAGRYYARVAPRNRSDFSPVQYTLSTRISSYVGIPKSIELSQLRTDYDTDGNNYVTWPQGYGYIVFNRASDGGWLEVQGKVLDSSGSPIRNSTYWCHVAFKNRYWNGEGQNPKLGRKTGYAQLRSDGTFTVRINEMPPPAGRLSYRSNVGLTHYYDLADIEIRIKENRNDDDNDFLIMGTQTVYHESFYMQ